MTERDAVAPDLSSVLNMKEGEYNMGPDEIIAPLAPDTKIQEADGLAMNALQKALLSMSTYLPDNSLLPKSENCQINAIRKVNQLSKDTLQKLQAHVVNENNVDLLTGRKLAMTNFAKFCNNAS